MEEVTVRVPDEFSDLVRDEVIERGALRSLAKKRLGELKRDLAEAERHVEAFEEKYDTDFESFEVSLDPDASREEHEDYNEWFFWVRTRDRIQERIDAVRSID